MLTLDDRALNIFLRTDFFFDGATPFREVRRVSPAPTIVGPQEIARDDAIDCYIALFRQAVRRRITPGATLALSGGQDSRHILLALHADGFVPDVLTVDLDTTNDAAIAQELARRVGAEQTVVPPARSIADARYVVRACDFLTMEHAWFADVARARDERAWWDGIAGDVLSAGLFLTETNVRQFEEGRLDELADSLTRRGRVPYFRDQSRFPRDEAVHAVRTELQRHVGAANPVGSFYFWNRTRVAIGASAFGLLAPNGQTTLAPYLDRDVWAFLASLPARMLLDKQFHADTIRRAYPTFADVPFAEKRNASARTYRRRALDLLATIVRERPTRVNAEAALRAARALVQPSRLSDIGWVAESWVYGDAITRIARFDHAATDGHREHAIQLTGR